MHNDIINLLLLGKNTKKGGFFMYDAKKEKKPSENSLKSDCVKDRGYFSNIENSVTMTTKASFIPVENIIQDFNS